MDAWTLESSSTTVLEGDLSLPFSDTFQACMKETQPRFELLDAEACMRHSAPVSASLESPLKCMDSAERRSSSSVAPRRLRRRDAQPRPHRKPNPLLLTSFWVKKTLMSFCLLPRLINGGGCMVRGCLVRLHSAANSLSLSLSLPLFLPSRALYPRKKLPLSLAFALLSLALSRSLSLPPSHPPPPGLTTGTDFFLTA